MRSDGSGLRRGTLSAGTDLPACWAAGAVRRGNEAVRSGLQEGGGRKRAARRDHQDVSLYDSEGSAGPQLKCSLASYRPLLSPDQSLDFFVGVWGFLEGERVRLPAYGDRKHTRYRCTRLFRTSRRPSLPFVEPGRDHGFQGGAHTRHPSFLETLSHVLRPNSRSPWR